MLERYTASSLSTYTGATMATVVITYALYVREMQDLAPLLAGDECGTPCSAENDARRVTGIGTGSSAAARPGPDAGPLPSPFVSARA